MAGWAGGYDEYLRSKHWRSIRAWALARANYSCEKCGWPYRWSDARRDAGWERHLHAHHLTYVRLGAELPDDVQVLCAVCHAATHGNVTVALWRSLYTDDIPFFELIGRDVRETLAELWSDTADIAATYDAEPAPYSDNFRSIVRALTKADEILSAGEWSWWDSYHFMHWFLHEVEPEAIDPAPPLVVE